MKKLSLSLLITGLGVASMGATLDGFREDEIMCEEAVARLVKCCSDFDPHAVTCSYSSGCGTTQYPAIDMQTSTCIREQSCEDLIGGGVCDRAAHVSPLTVSDEDGGATTTGGSGGVCR